jgi:hypothetical protein
MLISVNLKINDCVRRRIKKVKFLYLYSGGLSEGSVNIDWKNGNQHPQ